jgi:hypothetical protein
MGYTKENDIEAAITEKPGFSNNSDDYIPDDRGAVPAETFVVGDSWYAKTQRLAGKFGVEQRGIERVPNDERDNAHISQVGTMWLSANMVVSSFAIGTSNLLYANLLAYRPRLILAQVHSHILFSISDSSILFS